MLSLVLFIILIKIFIRLKYKSFIVYISNILFIIDALIQWTNFCRTLGFLQSSFLIHYLMLLILLKESSGIHDVSGFMCKFKKFFLGIIKINFTLSFRGCEKYWN